MSVEVKLPELGENIESGDVVSVLVSEGDKVSVDDPLVELETDKATVEVPSESEGTVEAVHVKAGDTVAVGQLLVTLDADSAEETTSESKQADSEPEADSEQDQSDEAQESKSSEEAEDGADQTPEAEGAERGQVVDFRPPPTDSDQPIPAAPSVRRFAREIGIDIGSVRGSGPSGRISVKDVQAYSRRSRQSSGAAGSEAAGAELPDFSRFGPVETEDFTNVRRATARHMATAWAAIPHVTNEDKADITELEARRKRFSGRVEEAGGKLTVTAIAIKVVVAALKRFPQFNASIDVAGQQIIYKHYYNIGIAVDTPRGLLVPVIRDADAKTLVELSVELTEIAGRARDAKLGPDALQGGSFTITNLGGLGATAFAPIVNFPEVAILGISRAATEPRYIDDQLQPRLIMPLSLSYDHRLIDGADAARFLRWTAEAFEEPFVYLLES